MPTLKSYCTQIQQCIITAHIRKMTEGNVFTLSTIWYPISGLDVGGGTLSQVWIGGVPHPTDGVVPPSKIRMGGTLGYRPPPSKTGWVTLGTRLDGIPPSNTEWGTPPPHQETDQQSKHLLHGGWCASCVHAGGLSC